MVYTSSEAYPNTLVGHFDTFHTIPFRIHSCAFILDHPGKPQTVHWIFRLESYDLTKPVTLNSGRGLQFAAYRLAERINYFGNHNPSVMQWDESKLKEMLTGLGQEESWKLQIIPPGETIMKDADYKTRKKMELEGDEVKVSRISDEEAKAFVKPIARRPYKTAKEAAEQAVEDAGTSRDVGLQVLILSEPFGRSNFNFHEDDREQLENGKCVEDPSTGVTA